MLVAAIVGAAAVLLIARLLPGVPVYVGVLVGLVALVGVLAWMARRYHWIMPWYYLLPAILFLLTFTLMPVVLTVVLAFTDYAGSRNTQFNPTTETAIVATDGATLTVSDIASLDCEDLRNGCEGVRVRLFASGSIDAVGVSLDGTTLTLAEPVAPDQDVTSVQLMLSDLGFAAQFPVTSVDGAVLQLGRAPPGAVDLEHVHLDLAGVRLERKVVAVDGNQLTLGAPVPTDLSYTGVARYNDFGFIGLANFRVLLAQAGSALLPVFTWNIVFAFLTVVLNIAVGLLLAVMLNDPQLRLRNLYRTLLILPWALPGVITIQVWRGLLNYNFGAINRLLALFGIPAVNWLGDPMAAKAALLLVNLWLSFPFMMVATLGALSAIPRELYEAARIDGASVRQAFRTITAPLLRSALVPVALTSFALSFNNFNLIFLLTDGGPAVAGGTSTARATDILISWAYNEAFRSQGGFAYGFGSAISILIFVLTLAVSLINFRVTGALKEEPVT